MPLPLPFVRTQRRDIAELPKSQLSSCFPHAKKLRPCARKNAITFDQTSIKNRQHKWPYLMAVED